MKNQIIQPKAIVESETMTSRRSFLTKTLGAGAAALAFTALPGVNKVAAQTTSGDLDILNYALTLEHLEYAFYRDGMKRFGRRDFTLFGLTPANPRSRLTLGRTIGNNIYENFVLIRDHEKTHVETLVSVIRSLGGTPVSELRYNFGYHNLRGFVKVAQALENTGVMAYTGALASIQSPDLQTAGATIATVEARHASYLNLLNGDIPFPAAFDTPKTMAEIIAIASQFIVS